MKHEAKIDEAINKATTAASDALGNVQQEGLINDWYTLLHYLAYGHSGIF